MRLLPPSKRNPESDQTADYATTDERWTLDVRPPTGWCGTRQDCSDVLSVCVFPVAIGLTFPELVALISDTDGRIRRTSTVVKYPRCLSAGETRGVLLEKGGFRFVSEDSGEFTAQFVPSLSTAFRLHDFDLSHYDSIRRQTSVRTLWTPLLLSFYSFLKQRGSLDRHSSPVRCQRPRQRSTSSRTRPVSFLDMMRQLSDNFQ